MKELIQRLRKQAQDQREEVDFHAESSVRALRHRLNEIACGRDLQWEWAPRFSSATRAANLALDLEAAADALERQWSSMVKLGAVAVSAVESAHNAEARARTDFADALAYAEKRLSDLQGAYADANAEIGRLRRNARVGDRLDDWLVEPVPDAPKDQDLSDDEGMAWRAGYLAAVNEVAVFAREAADDHR
jgi:hypothetical protein